MGGAWSKLCLLALEPLPVPARERVRAWAALRDPAKELLSAEAQALGPAAGVGPARAR